MSIVLFLQLLLHCIGHDKLRMLLIFQYVELNCDASLTYTECILILEELRYTFSIRNKKHHAAAVFIFCNVMMDLDTLVAIFINNNDG